MVASISIAAMLVALPVGMAAGQASTLTEAQAEQVGLQAYVYGLPLLDFVALSETQTSVTVPTGGIAPVNQLATSSALATPSDTELAPNTDTLYAGAHLDLSNGPVVLHVPNVGGDRYYSFEFLDPYTNVFAYLGTRTTGDSEHNFLIVGPTFHGHWPKRLHLRVIHSRYELVWMLGRTLVLGSSDLRAARSIESEYELLPLPDFSKFGLKWRRPVPVQQISKPTYHAVPTGLAFFDALGQALAQSPPPAQDAPILATLRTAGIGPGLEPSQENLGAAVVAGLTAAAAGGMKYIAQLKQQLIAPSLASNTGWFVPPSSTGDYGTDYALRAVIATDGLGANRPAEAMYITGGEDSNLKPLDGFNTYRITFPAGGLPPARFFWSLTMYDSAFLLVSNPLDRYAIGNRTQGLQYNADGSLDIYISHKPPPEGESNWLPAPVGAFEVTLRLYGPLQSAVDGTYRYPPIVKIAGPKL